MSKAPPIGTLPPSAPLADGFHTRPLNSGDIEFSFVQGGKTLMAGSCTQKQAGILAANFLLAANNAFHISERQLTEWNERLLAPSPVTVQQWLVAETKISDQKAMVARIGEADIAFTISDRELRNMARMLVAASWQAKTSLGTFELFKLLVRDFIKDFCGWYAVFWQRLQASSRRYAILLSSKLLGRSLQIFRTIEITPGTKAPKYRTIKKCIYCHAEIYLTKPGLENRKLGAEHIVPEGIGGTLELPEASCQKCEEVTGAVVEGKILGQTLKALRVHLNLKKSGSGSHPKTLPLNASVDGVEQKIDLPVDDYPIVFLMLQYTPPNVSKINTEQGRAVVGARIAQLRYDQKALFKKYRINGFSSAIWDNQMLCRMLAKIGHSLAVAEIGADKFSPRLLELIVSGNISAMNLIGGAPDSEFEQESKSLHDLALGYQRIDKRTFVVAKIRLFARHGGPVYYVVVGESLESGWTRFRRVFAKRISWMLAG